MCKLCSREDEESAARSFLCIAWRHDIFLSVLSPIPALYITTTNQCSWFDNFHSILCNFHVQIAVCFNLGRGRRRDSMIGCPLKPPSRTASETRQCSWPLTIALDDLDCREADCRRTAGGCRRELWAMSRGRSVRKYNPLSLFLLVAGFAASSLGEHRHGTLRNQVINIKGIL